MWRIIAFVSPFPIMAFLVWDVVVNTMIKRTRKVHLSHFVLALVIFIHTAASWIAVFNGSNNTVFEVHPFSTAVQFLAFDLIFVFLAWWLGTKDSWNGISIMRGSDVVSGASIGDKKKTTDCARYRYR